MSMLGALVTTTTLTSDASGSWGGGAFCEEKLFQLAWRESPGAVAAGVDANCANCGNVGEDVGRRGS